MKRKTHKTNKQANKNLIRIMQLILEAEMAGFESVMTRGEKKKRR